MLFHDKQKLRIECSNKKLLREHRIYKALVAGTPSVKEEMLLLERTVKHTRTNYAELGLGLYSLL